MKEINGLTSEQSSENLRVCLTRLDQALGIHTLVTRDVWVRIVLQQQLHHGPMIAFHRDAQGHVIQLDIPVDITFLSNEDNYSSGPSARRHTQHILRCMSMLPGRLFARRNLGIFSSQP